MTVTSLSASLQNKTIDLGSCMPHCVKLKIITYCPCQIVFDWTLSHKFKKWCKFSSHIKAKSRKKKSHKKRPVCNEICIYYLLCFFVFKCAVFFYLLVYYCLSLVTERACSALPHQSLAWDMILCKFHPPLITSSIIVNHCNILSSPFHFSKWPFYFKEFIFRACLFPYNFHFHS